jgi:hypothetical protein
MKPYDGTRDLVRDQLRHVDCGCLSDPPASLVNIWCLNPVTGVCYVARGTNTNERDNLDLAYKILVATHVGIHRAERLMYCFFEECNHSKAIIRLGDEDHGTHHTKKLLALNSYALSVGVSHDKLPYRNVTAPRDSVKHNEFMGFSYQLPRPGLHDMSNPADSNDGSVLGDSDETDDLEDDDNHVANNSAINEIVMEEVREMFGDDLDVEAFATEEEYLEATAERDSRQVDRKLQLLETAEEVARSNSVHQKWIISEIRKLLPEINGRESTMQSFERLTNKRPWIPFQLPTDQYPSGD